MAVERITAPSVEPLPTSDAKDHLRVTSTSDDSLIDGYVAAAREQAERFTRSGFIKQTFRHTRDRWPRTDIWGLPRGPMFSTTGVTVTYRPSSGGSLTFDSTNYIVDDRSLAPRLVLKQGESWPSTDLREAIGVEVDFDVGHSTSSTGIPEDIKHALKLMVGSNYEHREDIVVGSQAVKIPDSAEKLLWGYRVPEVAGAGDPRKVVENR